MSSVRRSPSRVSPASAPPPRRPPDGTSTSTRPPTATRCSAGNHLLKAGGTFLYERLNIEFPGALQGVYAFSSLANFQAGRYTNFQQAFGEVTQFQTNPNLGVFVQDEWRPRHDLTVNAGLRYDLQWIDDFVDTDRNNLSPRLGVAFAPGDGRTIVRGWRRLVFRSHPAARGLECASAGWREVQHGAAAAGAGGCAGLSERPRSVPGWPADEYHDDGPEHSRWTGEAGQLAD